MRSEREGGDRKRDKKADTQSESDRHTDRQQRQRNKRTERIVEGWELKILRVGGVKKDR